MLESHEVAKSNLMFSAVPILQQKIWKVSEIWVEPTKLTFTCSKPTIQEKL